MKNLLKIDYKGKYFVLQDVAWEDDFVCGEMSKKELTDEFLRAHIAQCEYFGIPAYLGKNKELLKRIDKIEILLFGEFKRINYVSN